MIEEELFHRALEMPTPAEQLAFLDQACADRPELRQRVERLLRSHRHEDSFLHQVTTDEPAAERPGTLIGPYKLIEPIGEGGMGTVWMAQQTEPVKRVVALKVIKAGMDSKHFIARFEAERQALALMDHANIARVLDAGTTGAGRPYFVMDFVKGVPITRYCDEHHLTPRQRLELFIPVCQAVQHAHQKGIIHRDLKPSNVLVARYDGKPVPKVIDFGVAKATGQSLTDKTLLTGFGNIVGTLEYMSPEQAEVNQLDVDTRSDIYSLGVLLYELLTGSPPFTKKELEKAGMLEMLRVIREQEPSKPSTKLSTAEGLPTLAANRGTEPGKLTKLVRGELDWIVMKALEKDRNRRYETANGFAMDVQRYLADEPVQACPPSASYRLRKLVRRNKAALMVTTVVAATVLFAVGSIGYMVRDRAAERTQRITRVASQVELILQEVDRLETEQKWPEALAAARRAEVAVAGGETDVETIAQVRRRLKDLEFIDRLELCRMQRVAWVDGSFDYAGTDREYARAFHDYGADVQELPIETSIDRLKARPALAIPLAAALDDWVDAARKNDDAGWKQLVAVARGIDPDPLRDRLRSTWGQPLSAELQDELCRIADSINIWAQSPVTLVIAARTLERVKNSGAAQRLLWEAQAVYPGDFWLNLELGSTLFERKDFEGGTRFYTAAVAIRPKSTLALTSLGLALSKQEKFDEAIACYRMAIEIDPKCGTYAYLGMVLEDQKKLDQAIASFKKAIEINPKDTRAHYNFGVTLGNELNNYDKAVECFRRAVELRPGYALAHASLGESLRLKGQLDEAVAECRKAIELDPNIAAPHNLLGNALRDQKKLDEAVTEFRTAIELDPDLAHAHNNLGNVLRDQKKLDEAIAEYHKTIEIDPKYVPAHRSLSAALTDLEKLEEERAAWGRFLDSDPPEHDAWYGYTELCLFLRNEDAYRRNRKALLKRFGNTTDPVVAGRTARACLLLPAAGEELEQAVALVDRALMLGKSHEYYAFFMMYKALAEYRLGRFESAVDWGQKAGANGVWEDTHLILAMAHSRLENTKQACASLTQALKTYDWKQNNGVIHALRREAEQLLKKNLDEVKKLVELDPKSATEHYNLGNVLKAQGDLDGAERAFREAVRLDGNRHGAAIDALAQLQLSRSNFKEALATALKAVELAPQSAIATQLLGWALYRTGDWKASVESFGEIVRLAG